MKNLFQKFYLLIFLSIIFCSSSNGQTNYDSLLFQKINEYRESKGLTTLVWDNKLFKASEHHSTYLVNLNKSFNDTIYIDENIYNKNETPITQITLSHYENKDIVNFNELKDISDREKYFLKENNTNGIGENCYVGFETIMDEKIAKNIIYKWIDSNPHNEFLLNKSTKYGSCSIVKYEYWINIKGKNFNNSHKFLIIYATFNAYY